jgi:hypothetical protein
MARRFAWVARLERNLSSNENRRDFVEGGMAVMGTAQQLDRPAQVSPCTCAESPLASLHCSDAIHGSYPYGLRSASLEGRHRCCLGLTNQVERLVTAKFH